MIVVSFVIVIVCDCNFFEFELEENLEKEDFMALFFLLEHSIRFVRLLMPITRTCSLLLLLMCQL